MDTPARPATVRLSVPQPRPPCSCYRASRAEGALIDDAASAEAESIGAAEIAVAKVHGEGLTFMENRLLHGHGDGDAFREFLIAAGKRVDLVLETLRRAADQRCGISRGKISIFVRGHDFHRPLLRSFAGVRSNAAHGVGVRIRAERHLIVARGDRACAKRCGIIACRLRAATNSNTATGGRPGARANSDGVIYWILRAANVRTGIRSKCDIATTDNVIARLKTARIILIAGDGSARSSTARVIVAAGDTSA